MTGDTFENPMEEQLRKINLHDAEFSIWDAVRTDATRNYHCKNKKKDFLSSEKIIIFFFKNFMWCKKSPK